MNEHNKVKDECNVSWNCDPNTFRTEPDADMVNKPPHYLKHPSGVECIQIVEEMGFNIGNAVKYCWRSSLKNNTVEDLNKAIWYLNREILRIERNQ